MYWNLLEVKGINVCTSVCYFCFHVNLHLRYGLYIFNFLNLTMSVPAFVSFRHVVPLSAVYCEELI